MKNETEKTSKKSVWKLQQEKEALLSLFLFITFILTVLCCFFCQKRIFFIFNQNEQTNRIQKFQNLEEEMQRGNHKAHS
jgi:cell division protein FtsW (lipid II flippase)